MKPQSKFRAVREDNLNRFYTHDAIGGLLVKLLGDISPSKVIDLGAGEGSLSCAVAKHWPNAQMVTVDIDPESTDDLHAALAESNPSVNHTHHIHDVLSPNLVHSLTLHGGFNLAVCNPPFFKPAWHPSFSEILQHANLSDACPSTSDVTAEILFLAQNLSLLRDGGTVALIIPDGLLTGWNATSFRRALLNKHKVECALQLPRHSFHNTEARCFILFLKKNCPPEKRIRLLKYNKEHGLLEPIFVSPEQAVQRMDYDYYATHSASDSPTLTLRQLGADIRRGSISNVEAKTADFPIFHTTDYALAEGGHLSFSHSMPLLSMPIQADKRLVVAETGDILMARVDRSLHQKVAIVTSGQVALTDCVYRIRLSADVRESVFEALISSEGSAKLQAASKGVSARLLGKADLLDLPLAISL